MIAPIVLAVALAAAAAAAPASNPEAALKSAEEAFDEASFDQALKALDKLVATAPDEAVLARAQLLRGRCFSAKGKPADAERAFALALEADPEARLDAAAVGPQLVKMLDDARARLSSQLRASADREGTQVLLDGKDLGTTPLKASVPIGRHKLSMKTADGRFAAEQEVLFFPKRVHEVSLALREVAPAQATAAGTPEPAAATAKPEPGPASAKPASEKPAQASATAGEERTVTLVGDFRAEGQPGKGLGFELGIGAGGQHWAVTVNGIAGGYWGVGLRGAAVFPKLVAGLGVYASLDVPVFFAPDASDGRKGGVLVGAGAAVGARYDLTAWLAPFFEVAGRYYFLRPDASASQEPFSVLLAGGVALRLP